MTTYKVADGAYFVPSYSEQTIMSFQPLFTNQTITVRESEEEIIIPSPEDTDKKSKIALEK